MTNLLIENIETLDPASVPDKFKNPDTGALRIDALMQSYQALEKKMSEGPSEPAMPHAQIPQSYAEYCVACDHGLFQPDEEINKRLHAKGMSQEQVQEVYDLAAEKMVPMVKQISYDFSAEREIEKLISHFGGPEQWRMTSKQLLAFGQRNLPADVLQNLSSSYEGVMALYKMMQSEEPTMIREESKNPASADTQDLQSMMRDPKYWKDKDPSFIRKVTDGFQKIYGE